MGATLGHRAVGRPPSRGPVHPQRSTLLPGLSATCRSPGGTPPFHVHGRREPGGRRDRIPNPLPDKPRARTGARQAQSPVAEGCGTPATRVPARNLVSTVAKGDCLAVYPGLKCIIARYDPSARTIEVRADAVASPRFEPVFVHEAAHPFCVPTKGVSSMGSPMTRLLRLEEVARSYQRLRCRLAARGVPADTRRIRSRGLGCSG